MVSHKSAGCCCCAVQSLRRARREDSSPSGRAQLPGAQGWDCCGRLGSLELHPVALPPHRHTGQQSEEERYARYKAGEHNCATGGEDSLPSEEQGGVERNPSPDWDNADQVQIMMMFSVSCWHKCVRGGTGQSWCLVQAACAGIGWVVGHSSWSRAGRLSVAVPPLLETLGVPPGVGTMFQS